MPIKIFESLGVVNKRFGANLNLRYLFPKLLNGTDLMSVGLRISIGEPLIARHHLAKVAMVSDERIDAWLTHAVAQPQFAVCSQLLQYHVSFRMRIQ